MVFLCNCAEEYKNYACVHSGVLSMLWNQDMKFPDTERAHHLKAKQTKKSLNLFEAVAKRNKVDKDKISVSSAQTDPKVIWRPVLPTYFPPVEDSGASMAVKGKCMVPAPPQAVMPCLSFPANASFADFFLAFQEEPSDVSTAVDVLAHTEEDGKKKADRLQLDVDLKLLVSSKSNVVGPAPPRHIPTHAPPRRKVCLHHAPYTGRELPDYLHTLTLSTESFCVSTASTGDGEGGGKRAWSASPSSARETRSRQRR
jgi:hypothetical protein